MDLTPLLGIGGALELPSFLLIGMLSIPVIGSVDLAVFMLLLLQRPLVLSIKESSSGLIGLDALVSYCQQIDHNFWLLHGDLLNSPDVGDPIMEVVDDLNVLDVHNSISSIVEMFHVISNTFIMFLFSSFQSLSVR
jgi:hypothetical protein